MRIPPTSKLPEWPGIIANLQVINENKEPEPGDSGRHVPVFECSSLQFGGTQKSPNRESNTVFSSDICPNRELNSMFNSVRIAFGVFPNRTCSTLEDARYEY